MSETARKVRKYLDWKNWFSGMWANSIKSATAVVLAAVGTNSAEKMMPTIAYDFGLDAKQTAAAFCSVLVIECIRFIHKKPLPDELERPVTPPPFPIKIP